MPVPIRILRDLTDELPEMRGDHLSPREEERKNLILAAGQKAMARFGRNGITIATLTTALRISPRSFRRHFADLDSLLAELIRRHLRAIVRTLGAIPIDTPNRPAAFRAGYIAYTRFLNGPTDAQILLIRERHNLPEDMLEGVDKFRQSLGEMLAGEHALAALAMLDMPELQLFQIDAALQAFAAAQPVPQPAPDAEKSEPAGTRAQNRPACPQPRRTQTAPPKKPQGATWDTPWPDAADHWLLPWQEPAYHATAGPA